MKWRILFDKRIKARSNEQIIEWTWFSRKKFLCSKYEPPLFWKLNDSAMLCDLCYVKKEEKTTFLELLSQSQVLLLFWFFFFFILNLSLIILLFGVYLCNKFINEMWTGRTMCTNSNIVIKYEYNFISPSHTGLCFMLWLDFNELVWLITYWLIQTVLYATQVQLKL